MTEIDNNPDCIVKAFENHSIFIFNKEIYNKKSIILRQLTLPKHWIL